jgi:hypothetical protein
VPQFGTRIACFKYEGIMEKKIFSLAILVATSLMVAPAMVGAAYYVVGDFNGWILPGNAMTDLGSGIWQLILSQISVGRHEFKVTVGDWSQIWPGSGNSWFYTDDGNITITFNATDIEDGWRGNWGRIGINVDPGAWTAVGGWQGWNNANPATAMTPLGSGVYYYQQVLAPNWYQWRAVVTGTWDAIGDDFRSITANSTEFEITASKPLARFWVDAIHGVIKVEAAELPPTLAKAFGASNILLHGMTSLTFTITNPATNTVALTGVAFTDNLPAGLVVANPSGLSSTCGGSATAVAESSSVSLSGATLPVNTSCTLSVNVTGTTAGMKNNTTEAVTSTNRGTGNTATASVNVQSLYVVGDFNVWNLPGNAMTDLGNGIWQLNLSQISVGRHEFKVTVGDWSQIWPGSGNSWLYTDDGNITITFNTNDIQDGWRGNWGRIGLNVDPGAWTAVGSWQGWNNANPATAMTPLGSGLYYYQQVLAPNWYQWRAVVSGTWDAIGDDFRGITPTSTEFEITASKPLARFWVDAIHGVIKVQATGIIYVAQDGLCGGKIPCVKSIQTAIDSAEAFTAIYVAQETYNENVISDNPNVITLQGGWDSSFTNCLSTTTINGSMTISDGTLIVGNIILQ